MSFRSSTPSLSSARSFPKAAPKSGGRSAGRFDMGTPVEFGCGDRSREFAVPATLSREANRKPSLSSISVPYRTPVGTHRDVQIQRLCHAAREPIGGLSIYLGLLERER